MKPRSRQEDMVNLHERRYNVHEDIIMAEIELRDLQVRIDEIDKDILRLREMSDGEWRDLYGTE